MSHDPLAEQYASIAPYSYCGGDPVNMANPTGMESILLPDKTHNTGVQGGDAGGYLGFGSSGVGMDSFLGYGLPGQLGNGDGLGGYYYDWYSGTYRTTDGDFVPYGEVYNNVIQPNIVARLEGADAKEFADYLNAGFEMRYMSSGNNAGYVAFKDGHGGTSVIVWTLGAKAGGGAAWDLNGDGIFQKNEADNWWLNGKGAGVTVDNSKIDWTGLEIPQGLSSGDRFAISTTNAFLKLPYETAATYGGTSFEVVGPYQVKVLDQLYHYNYRPNNSMENRVRNFMTWLGKPSGEGVDFMIYYSNPNIWIK